MVPTTLLFLLLAWMPSGHSLYVDSSTLLWKRADTARKVPGQGYYNPSDNGGSFLTQVPVTFPMGQGEPVNVIISGLSDDDVLVDAQVNGGLRNYFLSFGFSSECLGQRSVTNQQVNLGDGHGYLNETAVIRWNYGDPALGTCKETVQGGNHFRYWVQNGPLANSGAVFIAVSYELPIAQEHDIISNGYNLGRDWLIGNITQSTIPTGNLTSGSAFNGSTSFGGYTYHTDIKYVSGLLPNTSDGINHNVTVGTDGINAVDGLLAIFTVAITARPEGHSTAYRNTPLQLWGLPSFAVLLFLPLFIL